MNSQIAIPLLWDLGPEPKATDNNGSYWAKGAVASHRSRFLSRVFPTMYHLGLRSGLKQTKEN